MRRSRHPEYTLAIIAILVLLFFLWKLRNFLWRKRSCYPTEGSILSSREVGRTEHFIRYELTIGYTDRDGENEVVRLLTCNDAVAASDSVQLSVISRSVQRKGTGRKVQDLDERTYLRFDSEKRTELQQAFHFMEDMELTERKFSLYNLLFCPQLYVERAEFADKKPMLHHAR